MHTILNINQKVLKLEPLLDQISKWTLLPEIYDIVAFFLQGIDARPSSEEIIVKVHDNRIFVPTRSTRSRTSPVVIQAYHPDPINTPIPLIFSVAVMLVTAISLLKSAHQKHLKRRQHPARRRTNSLMAQMRPPSKLSSFAATLMLLSCLLWASGTIHTASKFVWTLFCNSIYTVVRWAVEHPGSVMATTSNLLLGFDVFDAFLSHLVLYWKARHSNIKSTLRKAAVDCLWLPVSSATIVATFLCHLVIHAASEARGVIRRKLGLCAFESMKLEPEKRTSDRSELSRRIGWSWIPIELSDGVPTKVDSMDLIPTMNIAQGGFGRLFQAKDTSSGKMVAVKRITKSEEGEPRLLDEIRAHHIMNSDPQFPSLLGCFLDEKDYILVMVR